MPLDTSILLGAQPIQAPDPMQMAVRGMTLGNLAQNMQSGQMALQAQQQANAAVPEFAARLARGENAQQVLADIAQKYPAAYPKLQADWKANEGVAATIAKDQAAAASSRATAFKEGLAAASNLANGMLQSGGGTPLQQQQLVAQVAHAYKAGGYDPKDVVTPLLGTTPDLFKQFTAGVAMAGQSPKDAAETKNTLEGLLPKNIAEANKANVEAGLAPKIAESGRISANAAASNAQSTRMGLLAPTIKYDPLGRPILETRFDSTGKPNASVSLAPGADALYGGSGNPTEAAAQGTANYQLPPANAMGRGPGLAFNSRVLEIDPNYSAQNYQVAQKTLNDFATGREALQVRKLNTSIMHLDTFGQLADALQNGDIRLINQAAQRVGQETGSPIPTNLDAAKQIVGKEVVAAIVAGGGGVSERNEVEDSLSRVKSPQQLKGVIDTYQQLLGGQMLGLKQAYESGTFGKRKDFESRLLLPRTQEVMTRLQAQGLQPTPVSASGAAATKAPPQLGEVRDGFLFKGGDPASRNSWEPVPAQGGQ